MTLPTEAPPCALVLLGSFQVTVGSMPVHAFRSDKVRALLAYLAVEATRPHRRTALAGLLWADQPERTALQNLRQSLVWLRRALPVNETTPPLFLITPQSIQFNPAVAARVDVTTFTTLLGRVQSHQHDASECCTHCAGWREAAMALYRGDFLDGFLIDTSQPFDEWMQIVRERLHRQAQEACAALVAYHEHQAAYLPAIAWADRLLLLEPWHEAAHCALMRLLAATGQRSAALQQYETCRRVLHEELGVEPTKETTELYDQIRRGVVGSVSSSVTRSPTNEDVEVAHLPSPATSFVGRALELAQIMQRLNEPSCRLLTLIGPGGIGKTRLALGIAAAYTHEAVNAVFADGATVVQLAAVTTAQHAVAAIAQAVGLIVDGSKDLRSQVARYLADKALLLVLDNFEQLVDESLLLRDILQAAPDVKLLVTSRVRLALGAEHVFEVAGLPFPEQHAFDDLHQYASVQLFVERARQVRSDFALAATNAASVVRICQLVEGLPLGIELAAAWVRMYTCDEIALEIERGVDFLATPLRDVPPRHRSIRAVFEHSWAILTDAERALLQHLSVFEGGCDNAAARAVASASPHALAGLVDASLLRRSLAGRYSLHPLVRQFAEEHLAALPAALASARERHGRYFVALLARHEAALKSAGQREARDVLEADIHNLRAAIRWAIDNEQLVTLGEGLEAVCLFYKGLSWLHEIDTVFAYACERLAHLIDHSSALDTASARALALLLAWHAWAAYYLGRVDDASEVISQSLYIARACDAQQIIAFCLDSQGCIAAIRGHYTEAQELIQTSLALYRTCHDQYGIVEALNHLGSMAYYISDLRGSLQYWREGLQISRTTGNHEQTGRLLHAISEASRTLGAYDEAREHAEESLALLRAIGQEWQTINPLNNLGLLAAFAGRYDEAQELIQQSLIIAQRVGHQRGIAETKLYLALVAFWSGRIKDAAVFQCESLAHWQAIGNRRGVAVALICGAQVAISGGDYREAHTMASEALAIARTLGDQVAASIALNALGLAATRLDDLVEADEAFTTALELLLAIHAAPYALDVTVNYVALRMRMWSSSAATLRDTRVLHHTEGALEVLATALHHPAISHMTRGRAMVLQQHMLSRLPPERAAALARSEAADFETLARSFQQATALIEDIVGQAA